jgi:hypothetical protein
MPEAFLGNGSVHRSRSKESMVNNGVTVGKAVFLRGPCQRVILKTIGRPRQYRTGICVDRT